MTSAATAALQPVLTRLLASSPILPYPSELVGAAKSHFETLNEQQDKLKYYFNFLTPEDYDYYFDHLRNGNFSFSSKLDAELEKNGS